MLVGWLLALALSFLSWFLSLWSFLPTFTLPSSFSLTVPIPFVASILSAMNAWLVVGLAVCAALIAGKILQWAYGLIPFKGT